MFETRIVLCLAISIWKWHCGCGIESTSTTSFLAMHPPRDFTLKFMYKLQHLKCAENPVMVWWTTSEVNFTLNKSFTQYETNHHHQCSIKLNYNFYYLLKVSICNQLTNKTFEFFHVRQSFPLKIGQKNSSE